MSKKNIRENYLRNNYNKNMQALKACDFDLYKRVEEIKTLDYTHVFTDQQLINLKNKSTGKLLIEGNIRNNIEKHVQNTTDKNVQLAVFLGFELGYFLNQMVKDKFTKFRTKKILIIEQDLNLFKSALLAYDYTEYFKNPHFIFMVGIPPEKVYFELQRLSDIHMFVELAKALDFFTHDSSLSMGREYYLSVAKELRSVLSYKLLNVGTSVDDSLIGLKNMFLNINEIVEYPGINSLYDAFKGKPAVLVASGPSLQSDIDKLKEIQDKALIICAQSTLKPLLLNGIRPHIVTSLERLIGVTESFNNIEPEDLEDVYLAACPVIPPEAYQVYTGPRLVVYRDFEHFNFLDLDKGKMRIKRSSANMSFKIADALGCDPIVLLGQDLCYAENSRTHVDGTNLGSEQEYYQQQETIYLKGNYKDFVETCRSWKGFHEDFEIDVEQYKGTCINATDGGAYIKGTVLMKFDQVIEKYLQTSFNPLDIIKDKTNEHHKIDCEKIYRRLDDKIGHALKDIERYKNVNFEGIDIISKNKKRLVELFSLNDDVVFENKDFILDVNNQIAKLIQSFFVDEPTFKQLAIHIMQSYWINFLVDKNSKFMKYDLYERVLINQIIMHEQFLRRNITSLELIEEILLDTEKKINEMVE